MSDEIARPADLPAGFTQRRSGLVVPTDANPREVERWKGSEVQKIQRILHLLERRDLLVIVGCRDNRCAEQPQLVVVPTARGFIWRCLHKDRLVERGR